MSSPSLSTCEGRTRAAAALLLLLLLAAGALGSGGPGQAEAQAGQATSGAPVYLGLGPSSLLPISGGAPVYTVGETIWAESGSNLSLGYSVAPPDPGSGVVASGTLSPGVVAPLYTFKGSDRDGVWNVSLSSPAGVDTVPVRFVNLADHAPLLDGPLRYSLAGGNLSVAAPASLGDSYDREVCAEGIPAQDPVNFTIPAGMGAVGTVVLSPGPAVGVTTLGLFSQPLSFWFELYQSYGLDANGTTNLQAYDLMAAQSQPIDLSGSGSLATGLTWNAPIRAGRYDLRAFFENSTSIEVSHYQVLVLNGSSWVPLTAGCRPQALQSTGVSYSGSLAGGEASWPRTLYYMYRVSGVEAVAAYPLRANLSSIEFLASPWDEPLQDAVVSVASSAGVAQTSQQGSSLFVLSSAYPSRVDYSLAIGGVGLEQGSSAFGADNSVDVVGVSLAQLTVGFSTGEQSPISLSVRGPSGMALSSNIQAGERTATLFLPTGTYTLTASQSGQSQSAQVDLVDGQASSASMSFGTLVAFEGLLVVTAVAAALANVLVFVLRSRR